jgi:phage host-nuclease inhibitor protein Gam
MPIPPNIASASTGSALGGYTEAVSIATGLIVNYAFASSIKSDQKRFEKEIAKLSAKKQEELLAKIQQAETEIERQKIVYQYVDKQKIDELKKEGKKQRTILYVGLGIGVLLYAILLLKLKNDE